MRLKVKYAKLQTEYFSTGTGNLGTVFETDSRHKGMQMEFTEKGLFVEYKGVHFAIPLGNIVGVTFYERPNLDDSALPALKVLPLRKD